MSMRLTIILTVLLGALAMGVCLARLESCCLLHRAPMPQLPVSMRRAFRRTIKASLTDPNNISRQLLRLHPLWLKRITTLGWCCIRWGQRARQTHTL